MPEKKIMNTKVEFISTVSSVCHCPFFLDLPLVMSDADSVCIQPILYFQGSAVPDYLLPLLIWYLAVRFKHCRVGPNLSWVGGYPFPSSCCCLEGSGLPEQDGCCVWRLDQHWDPWLLSQFSSQGLCPQSLFKLL